MKENNTIQEKALYYLYKKLKLARVHLGKAERKKGAQQEVENIHRKIDVLEWLSYIALKEDGNSAWISVKEKLPENDNDVAVIVRYSKDTWMYKTAWLMNGKDWWVNGERNTCVEVTHWMPLPEHPNEVDDENA